MGEASEGVSGERRKEKKRGEKKRNEKKRKIRERAAVPRRLEHLSDAREASGFRQRARFGGGGRRREVRRVLPLVGRRMQAIKMRLTGGVGRVGRETV